MLHHKSVAGAAALALLFALGGCSLWQGEAPPIPAPRTDILQPGDNVWIAVAGEQALSGLYPVRQDGTVWMDLLGALPAAGVALPAFQENLRQRLAAGYLRQPLVEVTRVTGPVAPSLRKSQPQ
jgi:polysaccharide export outer membrane protein